MDDPAGRRLAGVQASLNKDDLLLLPLGVLEVGDSEYGHVDAPERLAQDLFLEVPAPPPPGSGHIGVIRVETLLLSHLFIAVLLLAFVFEEFLCSAPIALMYCVSIE